MSMELLLQEVVKFLDKVFLGKGGVKIEDKGRVVTDGKSDVEASKETSLIWSSRICMLSCFFSIVIMKFQ